MHSSVNTKNNKYFNTCFEIGLVLLVVGMQFGTALKNVLGGLDLVNFIMILSCILMIDYSNLLRGIFFKLNKSSIILILFQILMIIYALLSKNQEIKLYFYHLYLIVVIISLATQNRKKEFKNFFRYLFYISAFIAIVVFWQATNGGTELITSYRNTGKLWLEEGGDPITMSRALEIYIIIALVYQSKNIFEKLFKVMSLVASIIGLFSFSNRAVIIGCLFVYIVYILNTKLKSLSYKKIIKGIMIFAMIFLFGFILFKYSSYIQTKVMSLIKSTINGINTYLGIGSGELDASALTRNLIRTEVFEIINTKFSIINYLFGYGYNFIYIDMPVIQIFFDMGIVGFSIYVIYTLYIPIKFIMTNKNSKIDLFIKLFLVQMVFDQFYCGLPYYYFYFTPAILIMLSYNQKSEEIITTSEVNL